jgi:hypothetical protein
MEIARVAGAKKRRALDPAVAESRARQKIAPDQIRAASSYEHLLMA